MRTATAAYLVMLFLAASALPHPAAAQTSSCGAIQLVFRNPDLQPAADGFIHAQGQFFAQFQAIGADADKIKVFGFSFGPQTTDVPPTVCQAPLWATGTYVPNYRADRNPADGFFIPIKTGLVPDGTYAVAVHAYDASNTELARFWGKAIVDNCDTAATSAQEKCDTDAAQMAKHDKTEPWPMVLPGDGQALDGHKFTIEFGEALASYSVFLNGVDITGQMVAWDGRLWDADYEPDYGPGGASGLVAPPCSGAPGQTCEHYGPAYEWLGRDLVANDVLHVEAVDLAGNRAVKDVHIGSSVSGGAITDADPILSYTVDHPEAQVASGAAASFHFNMTNSGGGTAHPFAEAKGPAGWTLTWEPNHVPVPPGSTQAQTLTVKVPAGAANGKYLVNATLTYSAGGKEKVLAQPLDVVVGGVTALANQTTTTGPAETKSSAALPLPFLAVAFAVLVTRRKR